jgi:uncharacterized protein
MIYLIDGHNLIPKIRGLSLKAIDDEVQLIELLQNFTRVHKGRIEVFFDGAPIGHAGTRSYGTLKAHFIPIGRTADDAIRSHLDQLGVQAKQVMVVTSDRQVQSDVRKHHAGLITSEHFAEMLLDALPAKPPPPPPKTKQPPPRDPEIDEWLRLFGQDPDKQK